MKTITRWRHAMARQNPYNPPQDYIGSEPRMALLFLLDTSASMQDEDRIGALNAGLNRFKEEVCENDETKRILDVAIVRFDTKPEVVQEFRPIDEMMHVNLPANGDATIYSPAIRKALEMVNTQTRLYKEHAAPYKPWILFITDGEPQDDITDVAEEVRYSMEKKKVSFRCLGVGEYKPKPLHTLTGNDKNVMRLAGTDFMAFFDWVNKSMYSVSQSTPGSDPNAVRLGGNVTIDPQDTNGAS
jgi:uncharacterized protein YegL